MKKVVDEILFGKTTVTYEILRSRRRSLAISVKPDATVTVVAPTGIRRNVISELVRSRAEWIIQKQDRIVRLRGRRIRQLASGASMPYLGRDYQLKILRVADQGVTARVQALAGQFRICVGRRWSQLRVQKAVRNALEIWYRKQALRRISSSVDRLGRRLGVTCRTVQIYEMPTRWGSGGISGRLRFNWRIVMAPARLVDYVVAHELCHVRHTRHSLAFWRMLAAVMPDHDQRRSELAMLGPRLDIAAGGYRRVAHQGGDFV